ncbi:MAG: ABC transporter ATP-binding protein [Desulfarculus sp.]|nr:ABC transporter ATP-binding protein [Desulfarculus sp.]
MTDSAPFILIEQLYKTYRGPRDEVEVLRGLDLRVEARETVAILGASGVGKSTLLHILGALDRPSRGRVVVGGENLTDLGERQLAGFRNRNIGFVFQFHHLLPEFTALENVMMPALIARQPRGAAEARARELLAEVGLDHRQTHRVGELSGGEQQRVAVARALVMGPSLLLADEPTGNLDERTGEKVQQLFLRLNAEMGLTTLVATHNERLAAALGRRVRLAEGRLFPLD